MENLEKEKAKQMEDIIDDGDNLFRMLKQIEKKYGNIDEEYRQKELDFYNEVTESIFSTSGNLLTKSEINYAIISGLRETRENDEYNREKNFIMIKDGAYSIGKELRNIFDNLEGQELPKEKLLKRECQYVNCALQTMFEVYCKYITYDEIKEMIFEGLRDDEREETIIKNIESLHPRDVRNELIELGKEFGKIVNDIKNKYQDSYSIECQKEIQQVIIELNEATHIMYDVFNFVIPSDQIKEFITRGFEEKSGDRVQLDDFAIERDDKL